MKKLWMCVLLSGLIMTGCGTGVSEEENVVSAEAITKESENWITLSDTSYRFGGDSGTSYESIKYHKKAKKVVLFVRDVYDSYRAGGGVDTTVLETGISLNDARELYGE